MAKHSVDGMIFIGGEQASGSYGIQGIPIVMVDRGIDDPSLTSVALDNEYGGQLAADYLFSLGHERIAFLTSDYTAAEQKRLQGYVTAHQNRGVPVDGDLIIHLEESQWHQGDLNRILRVFSLNNRPTAIFASNDFKALQVLRLFRRNNISVPDDISVIGFDDIEISSMVHPALTTVHQPIDRMVELGAQLLLDQLDGGVGTGVRRVMSPWLVERESVRRIA
jgi:LacI family transcriptional regulator